jgi:hypothetical protein
MYRRKLLATAGIVVGALYFGLPTTARAAVTDTFCGPSSGNGCETGADQMVFLQKQTNTMLGFGNVGGPSNSLPTMDIHSTGGMLDMFLDLANGFATIKPHNNVSFNGLDITIPGFGFTALIFDTQDTPSGNPTDSFTLTGFSGAHVNDGSNTETSAANSDNEYSITAHGGVFDEVSFTTTTGFDEVKHIEVDGLCTIVAGGGCTPVVFAAPEPASMLILGTSALGLMWARKSGRKIFKREAPTEVVVG